MTPRLRVGSLIRHADGNLRIVTALSQESIRYRKLYAWERAIRWALLKLMRLPEPEPMSRQQTRAAVGRTVKRVAKVRAKRWQRQRRGM